MKRLLVASAALLSLAGVAAAQQAPSLVGNYSANVLDSYNGTVTQGVEFSGQAGMGAHRDRDVQVQTPQAGSALQNQNYSR